MRYSLVFMLYFFFLKQKTAYEMRISDWSSDVCSSDLADHAGVVDRRIHLQAVADDAGVGQQAGAVAVAVVGDLVDIKAVVGTAEAVALAQDRFPAQAVLVDFQKKAFEQHGRVASREAVLGYVVGTVPRVHGRVLALSGYR